MIHARYESSNPCRKKNAKRVDADFAILFLTVAALIYRMNHQTHTLSFK